MTQILRFLALALYYAACSHLPDLAFPAGRVFNRARCALLRMILPSFGHANEVDGRVYLGDGTDVHVGSRCQINRGCRLNRVEIGDCVMLGPDVIVVGQLHRISDTSRPMVAQGEYTKSPTVIEDDVWIGARVIIMPGVVIASGAVVGAGAVVTRDVAPRRIVAGVPARVIGQRSP
ncbi:MAG: acyltransferase [Solirubrobacteraceae bacterium]